MSKVSSVRAKKCSLLSAHQCRHCMQRISKERSKDQDTDVSLYTKGLYYYSGWGPFIYDVTTLSHPSYMTPVFDLKCTLAVLYMSLKSFTSS